MKEVEKMLFEGIKENTSLLMEIKEELQKELSVVKLAQQKLKYYVYGVMALLMVHLGKPELLLGVLK